MTTGHSEPTPQEVFTELEKEVISLHIKWNQFKHLYAKETIDVRMVAAKFFNMLFAIQLDDILLSICRLTDKPKVSGHKTLSLKRLPMMLEGVDTGLKAKVEAALDTLENQVSYAREHRDLRISHSDFDALFGLDPAKKLDTYRETNIEQTLQQMSDLLNTVRSTILGDDSRVDFGSKDLEFFEGAQMLLNNLKVAKEQVEAGRGPLKRFHRD